MNVLRSAPSYFRIRPAHVFTISPRVSDSLAIHIKVICSADVPGGRSFSPRKIFGDLPPWMAWRTTMCSLCVASVIYLAVAGHAVHPARLPPPHRCSATRLARAWRCGSASRAAPNCATAHIPAVERASRAGRKPGA